MKTLQLLEQNMNLVIRNEQFLSVSGEADIYGTKSSARILSNKSALLRAS